MDIILIVPTNQVDVISFNKWELSYASDWLEQWQNGRDISSDWLEQRRIAALYIIINSRTSVRELLRSLKWRVSHEHNFFLSDHSQTFFGHVSSNFPTFFCPFFFIFVFLLIIPSFFAYFRGITPQPPYQIQEIWKQILTHTDVVQGRMWKALS